jgi:S1-C subfamily serine protease
MISKLQKITLFSLILLLLNSCSLAYFVSKDQKVTILKDPKATVLIEKKEPLMNKNKDKYVLHCDGNAKQVTIKKDGYKTINKVFVPYNLSPAAYGTIAINAAAAGITLYTFIKNSESGAPPMLFGALGTVIGGVWGTGVAAFSPEFLRFDRTIHLDKDSLLPIPTRDSLMKEIKLNKVGVDIKPENMEEFYPTYSEYLKGKYTKKFKVKGIDATKIEDTYFSDELNTLLKKSGFVDTSRLVLKSSYNQNTFLDATIIGLKNTEVINSSISTNTGSTMFSTVDLKIKWDVLDYYKNVVYSDTINSKSGEFLSSYTVTTTAGSTITSTTVGKSSYLEDAIRDAIETGLYTLMNKSKFKSFLKLDKVINQDTLAVMELKKASSNVSSIEQAVQASVTVKTKNGHGSGFFISEDGFIVTNYHVVSDSAKLEVIMNDGVKYPAKIIRVNKTSDLALLKIEKNGIVPFDFSGKSQPAMGNEIYVIGTPSAEDLSQTLSKGIISSIRKQTNGSKIIQTDASISLGNSGGPLIEKGGNLLGIVNAKLVGMGVEGISFAIPANEIAKCLSIKSK